MCQDLCSLVWDTQRCRVRCLDVPQSRDMKPAVSAPRPEAPDFAEAMKELKVHMKTWMEDGKRVYGFVGSPSFTRNRCTTMSFRLCNIQ